MRHATLAALCILLAAAGAFGETSSVTLQNQEPSVFWYAVDPPGLEDLSVGSRQLAQRVEEYFAAGSTDFPFRPLDPDAAVTLEGLAQGTHLVVGFFLVEGEGELPVRAFSVQVDQGPGDRFYALFSGPALLTIARTAPRLAGMGEAGNGAQAVVEDTAPDVQATEEAAPVEEQAVAEEQPVPEEAVAEEQPVLEEIVAEEQPAPEEAVAEEQPAPEEAVAEGQPAAEEAAVEEQPVPEEAIAEEQPSLEQAAVEEQPVAEEAVAAEAPAAEEAPPVEAAAPDQPAEVAAFSPAYSPVVFTRESKAGFTVLPISQSRHWGEPGTKLESVEGILRDGVLEMTVLTQDGFSSDVSYFFYVFAARTLGRENALTFELLPLAREGRGALVLWQKLPPAARAVPRFVGTVTTYGRTCTVELDLAELPPEARAAAGANPSIDLSSCRYDARDALFEEFYYTSLDLADFPGAAGAVTR